MRNFKQLKIWQKAFEIETQLRIAEAVNFGNKNLRDLLLNDIDEEQKMLIGFMNNLIN